MRYLPWFLVGFSWAFALYGAYACVQAVSRALNRADQLCTELEKRPASAQLERLGAALADLEDRHIALHDAHKRLAARVGMRDVRARRNGHDVPDDETPQEKLRRLEIRHGLRSD